MLHKKPSQKLLKRACLIAALGAAVLLPGWSASADEAKDHFDKGVELYKARKDSEALKEFDLALKIRPGDPTILNWIGFINLQDRNYKEAQEPLEKVVKLRPNSAEAHLNLGNVYDGLKQYPEAIREFETVARLQQSSSDPSKAADPYYNMGSVYYKMHRLPESVAAYQRAAALNPKDAYIQDG